MKLLTMRKESQYELGVQTSRGILDVKQAAKHFALPVPYTMEGLIESGQVGLKALTQLVSQAQSENVPFLFLPEETLVYGPCVTSPEKIVCVGLNYRKHAVESKMPIPTSPVLFSKFNNSLAAHQDTIKLSPLAEKIDYEVELVIVIGKTAQNVSEAEALSYVFGYATGNDLSDRGLQFRSSQWLLGKTCDGFAPVGPYLVTADEVPNPDQLHLESRVNGEIRQSSNTQDMIFNCATMISYISQYMTLQPGDLIYTGTPEGVIIGYPPEKQVWLKAGDEVVTSVEGLGELRIVLA
ncbi:MAG: fumarylacetoacetate hydrolase family protein [Negativicutes bacterium]|nr:fumarylacetoacetate hydrolase family protein [Negativicutes bacterium]